jgi:hypothetical protein
MKLAKILLMMLILIQPYALALELQTNTTVTLDFVGSDMYYLRTESGDLGPYNISIQTDRAFQVNITRHTETNQTEFEQLITMVVGMNKTCANISGQLVVADSGYQELSRNWSRCNLDKEALMIQVPQYQSAMNNWSAAYNQTVNGLLYDKAVLTDNLNTCNAQNVNMTSSLAGERQSNSNKTILVVICVAVAGVLIYQEIQKKQKAHPDEMSLLSQQ